MAEADSDADADEDTAAPAFVLLAPGGMWYHELTCTFEAARWAARHGAFGVVVHYRVRGEYGAALEDVGRVVQVLRSVAREWGIDPGRVGVMGFSAGGALAASLAAGGLPPVAAGDAADGASPTPDFLVAYHAVFMRGHAELTEGCEQFAPV